MYIRKVLKDIRWDLLIIRYSSSNCLKSDSRFL